jgi:hypothetical protein
MNTESTSPGLEDAPAEAASAPGRIGLWFGAAAALGMASSILVRAATLPVSARFALALLPAPALIGAALAARRIARGLDELERRVQLEALATAFCVAGIAFLLYTQFQVAGMLGPEDWIMPWVAIWGGYLVGLGSARRRLL